MLKIWQLEQKQGNSGKLSIIVPLVLYHGRARWKVNERFLSVFNGPAGALTEYIPDFRYVLYDLSQYSDEQIKGTVMARVTMLLLKHIFESDISSRLPGIFSLLKDLSEKQTGLQYFESLIKYIFSNVDDITVDQMQSIVSSALLEDKGDFIMTLAEKIRKEGLEQGLLEGVELAVSIKFGDTEESRAAIEKIRRVKNINLLKALKDRIRTAASPSDLTRIIDSELPRNG